MILCRGQGWVCEDQWWHHPINWKFIVKVSQCCISEGCKRWRLDHGAHPATEGVISFYYIVLNIEPQIGDPLSKYLPMERWSEERECNLCGEKWHPTILEVHHRKNFPTDIPFYLPSGETVSSPPPHYAEILTESDF